MDSAETRTRGLIDSADTRTGDLLDSAETRTGGLMDSAETRQGGLLDSAEARRRDLMDSAEARSSANGVPTVPSALLPRVDLPAPGTFYIATDFSGIDQPVIQLVSLLLGSGCKLTQIFA